jgi:tRNA A-37 threonylcarbamoyl transferase component Bud32
MRFCPRCGSRYDHERFCPEDGVATQALPDTGPAKDALIGTVVDGRYRIGEQIGEGGMGVVYKALHVTLNKTLALKVLRGEMAKDPEVVQRFIQEAQAATSIGHENIIDISDFGRLADGTVYFVMEYLNGNPLNQMIKRGGSIPVADAVAIIRQIASALGAAHLRGIVHRDLKPDNVYVVTRGEQSTYVKVLDFGIAKVGGASNKLTRTGMVFGTPHYMSPEQAAGQSVDARTDIYALGVIMYEMFTGRVPFDADTFMAVLTKHMFEQPAPMNAPGAERMLGAIEQITLRALEKKPENRYQTMQELVDDLDRVVGGGVPKLSGMNTGATAALADALEPRTRSEMNLEAQMGGGLAPPPHPHRWLYAGGGVLFSLALLLVAFWALRAETKPAATMQADTPPALPGLPQVAPAPPAATSAPVPRPEGTPPPTTSSESALRITTEPDGAAIVMDGAIIGHTPAQLPRFEGSRLLELRLEGFLSENVRISPSSPDQFHIRLRRRPPAGTSRQQATAAAKRPPVAPTPSPRPRVKSEVVDPWE